MKYFGILLSLIFLASSCGTDTQNNDDNKNSTEEEAEVLGVFEQANAAISSAGNGLTSGFTGSLSSSKITTTCTSGEPDGVSQGDPSYAGEKTNCMFNSNSKSPDTMMGSYFVVAGVICAIEKSHSFTYASDFTIQDGITLSELDSCFGVDGFDLNDDDDTSGSIIISMREKSLSGAEYDFQVDLQLGPTYDEGSAPHITFYLRDSNGVLAAKIDQPDSITEIVLDSTNNEVLFENKDYDNDRHIRVKIEGTFSPATGEFSSVTNAKLLHSEGDTGSESYSVIFGWDGTNEFYDHYLVTTQDADYDTCLGVCSSITTTYNSSFHDFTGNSISVYEGPSTILNLNTFDMSF